MALVRGAGSCFARFFISQISSAEMPAKPRDALAVSTSLSGAKVCERRTATRVPLRSWRLVPAFLRFL